MKVYWQYNARATLILQAPRALCGLYEGVLTNKMWATPHITGADPAFQRGGGVKFSKRPFVPKSDVKQWFTTTTTWQKKILL